MLRAPFTVVKTALTTLIMIPRLPSLAHEHAELRAAVLQHQLEQAQLQEAFRQAAHTDALQRLSPVTSGVVAHVIAHSILPTQHTVLLDRGTRDGVWLKSLAVNETGVVGRVVEAHPTTALVMLLTDTDSRIAGLVERSRETGLVVGRGAGPCELIDLDVESDVRVGDRVVTAGLGGEIPKGLVLGTITRVVKDELSGAAWARMSPAARLGQLEDVLCLPPKAVTSDQ